MQAAWCSRPRLVEILKYAGRFFHSKNMSGLLIFITRFIIIWWTEGTNQACVRQQYCQEKWQYCLFLQSSTGWFGDRGFETPNSSLGKEENRMKDTIQVKKTLIKTVLMKSGMSITCKAILSILYQFNIELYCKKFFNHLYFQWNYYRDIKVLWLVVWRWWLFNFIFCFDHKRSFICAGSNYSVVGYFFSSATSEIFHPRENDRSNCVPGWLSSVLSTEWIWAEGQRD